MQNLQVDLKDRNGESITTKAYIQSVLNEIDSTSNSSTSYSSRFNRFFASLDSFALPFPSTNFKDAQRLNEMKEDEFTAEYREEKNKLKARTLSLVQPKKLGKNLLQGRMFAQLITAWTENVNIPIDTARENSASALMRHINQKVDLTTTIPTPAIHMYSPSLGRSAHSVVSCVSYTMASCWCAVMRCLAVCRKWRSRWRCIRALCVQ